MNWEEVMKKDVSRPGLKNKLKEVFDGAEAAWQATRNKKLSDIRISSMYDNWYGTTDDPQKIKAWEDSGKKVFELVYKNVKEQLEREFMEAWNSEPLAEQRRRLDYDSNDEM
jgi:hypothetical protein